MSSRTTSRRLILIPMKFRPRKKLLLSLLLTVALPEARTPLWARDKGFAYVANAGSWNVSTYTIDERTGALTQIAGSPFVTGQNPISVVVSTNGKFAYVTNLFSNTVSAYTIDAETGGLTPVNGSPFAADTPYSMALSPNGRFAFVTDYDSTTVSAFTINAETGALTPVAGSPFATGLPARIDSRYPEQQVCLRGR